MTRGVFRDGDKVYVSYDGRKPVPIAAQRYQMRGYEPPIEELPAREQYENPTIATLLVQRNQLRHDGGGLMQDMSD